MKVFLILLRVWLTNGKNKNILRGAKNINRRRINPKSQWLTKALIWSVNDWCNKTRIKSISNDKTKQLWPTEIISRLTDQHNNILLIFNFCSRPRKSRWNEFLDERKKLAQNQQNSFSRSTETPKKTKFRLVARWNFLDEQNSRKSLEFFSFSLRF